MSILNDLRIFGFSSSQENAVFASLLIGEPLLFIGGPGLAKTEVVESIGSALREDSKRLNPSNPEKWFSYQIYDASKLNFEDLIGYPNPHRLKADPPEVTYVPTKSTIWGKHMIAFDELNRCVEERQSNLFEIIRSRKLHGIDTGNKFIFSTMNPFGDQGTVGMSDALVDRHLFYLRINRFAEMDAKDRKKVIHRIGKVDGVGLRYWGSEKQELDTSDAIVDGKVAINNLLADVGVRIRGLMQNGIKILHELKESTGEQLTEVIDKVVVAMHKEFAKEAESLRKETDLSGRRASAILRGILALRAIEICHRSELESLPDITSTIINGIKLAVPIGISGKLDVNSVARADKVIETTVRTVWPLIKQKKDTVNIDKISEAMNTNNPIKILDCLLGADMNALTKDKIFSLLLDEEKYRDPVTKNVNTYLKETIYVMLHMLGKEIPNFIPHHLKIEASAAQIENVSKKQKIPIKGHLVQFSDILVSMITNASKGHNLLLFSIKAAILYYIDNINSDEQAIRAILDIRNFSDSIAAKLNIISNETKNTTDTAS